MCISRITFTYKQEKPHRGVVVLDDAQGLAEEQVVRLLSVHHSEAAAGGQRHGADALALVGAVEQLRRGGALGPAEHLMLHVF